MKSPKFAKRGLKFFSKEKKIKTALVSEDNRSDVADEGNSVRIISIVSAADSTSVIDPCCNTKQSNSSAESKPNEVRISPKITEPQQQKETTDSDNTDNKPPYQSSTTISPVASSPARTGSRDSPNSTETTSSTKSTSSPSSNSASSISSSSNTLTTLAQKTSPTCVLVDIITDNEQPLPAYPVEIESEPSAIIKPIKSTKDNGSRRPTKTTATCKADNISRLSVSPTKKMFTGSSGSGGSSSHRRYTSLEYAVWPQYASMLAPATPPSPHTPPENDVGGNVPNVSSVDGVLMGVDNSNSDDNSATAKNFTGNSSHGSVCDKGGTTTSSSSEAFLALKKDAEKNEFKKVKQLAIMSAPVVSLPPSNKDSTTTSKATRSSASSSSSSAATIPAVSLDHQVQEDKTAKKKKTTWGGFGLNKNDNKKEDEVKEGHIPTLSDEVSASSTCTPPKDEADLDKIIRDTRTIQEFSFDQDFISDMNNNNNDDNPRSCCSSDSSSYYSIESIGDITICSETERLLSAHKVYHDDSKTNVNHPARQKPSIMKVGSVYKNITSSSSSSNNNTTTGSSELVVVDTSLSNDCSIHTEAASSSCSIRTEEPKTEKKKLKLSWYDDEQNRYKPFILRTDESFCDGSTLTSSLYSSTTIVGGMVVNKFWGDIIKGLAGGKCGNEEDGGSSFDVGNNDDIGEQGQHKGQQHDIIKRLTKCGTGQEVICFDVGNDIEEEI